jgi:hypothetical protein
MYMLKSLLKLFSIISLPSLPLNINRKIDQGSNPESVTSEYFELCKNKNDEARGRIFSTKVFIALYLP